MEENLQNLITHFTDLATVSKSEVTSTDMSRTFWRFTFVDDEDVLLISWEISWHASDNCWGFLARMETFAPLLTHSFATSFPIPLDPPVMRTCFPFKNSKDLVFRKNRFCQIHDINISRPIRQSPIKNINPRPLEMVCNIDIWKKCFLIAISRKSLKLFGKKFRIKLWWWYYFVKKIWIKPFYFCVQILQKFLRNSKMLCHDFVVFDVFCNWSLFNSIVIVLIVFCKDVNFLNQSKTFLF